MRDWKSESWSERRCVVDPDESRPSPIAIVYRSEFDYISRCILDYKNIETGGQLFGFWTSAGIPVILYAIGPGRNANHQDTFFNQDVDYLVKVGNFVLENYGLQHIGEWHSHHQLGLAHPSGHDASTMVHNIERSHLRRFLLCIGNCTEYSSTLNAFNFHEDHGYDYVQAGWSIKECVSPFRPLVDGALKGILIHPRTLVACHGEVYGVKPVAISQVVEDYGDGYWLNNPQNRKVLASINGFLKGREGVESVKVTLDDNRHALIDIAERNVGKVSIAFPSEFPQKPADIRIDGVAAGEGVLWNFQGDILEVFSQYYVAATRPKENLMTSESHPEGAQGQQL